MNQDVTAERAVEDTESVEVPHPKAWSVPHLMVAVALAGLFVGILLTGLWKNFEISEVRAYAQRSTDRAFRIGVVSEKLTVLRCGRDEAASSLNGIGVEINELKIKAKELNLYNPRILECLKIRTWDKVDPGR